MKVVDNRPIHAKEPHDVVVVGGGIAGIAAAVAASRAGAKTLLLEKSIVLGGLATAGLISWYEPLCDSRGRKMVGGIAEELIRLSIRYGFGNLPPEWTEGTVRTDPPRRFASFFSPTIFAMALDEYLLESNVAVALDCHAVFPVMQGHLCSGIVAEVKEGRAFYGARVVVDATGDASVFHAAGAKTVLGQNYLSYFAHSVDAKAVSAYLEDRDMLRLRKWVSMGSNLYGQGQPEGMPLAYGVTGEDITKFVLTGRSMLFERVKQQDVNERDITMLPFMPQFRTIRRIVGDADFIAADRAPAAHSIGSTGDFRAAGAGKHYHIPYEALYASAYPNLAAAGRIISAPAGDGWEVARVIPTCALTGQAAGVAAALSVRHHTGLNELAYAPLRDALEAQGALFVD